MNRWRGHGGRSWRGRAVGDDLVELGEGVRQDLHPAAVVGDRECTLLRGAELSVHHKNVCLAVAGELLLEGEPGATGGRSPHRDDLVEVADDGAVEPRQDVEVHPHPVWNGGERGVAKGMVGERVLAKGEEHEAAPLGEGWRGEIEDDRDEGADVEDAEGLRMEGSTNVDVTSG